MSDDLSAAAVTEALGDRPVRIYPALLSTEADAQSWARSGGPDGGVVTAAYQVSPRGRAGLPWEPDPAADVAFSLLLRPQLSAEREGWLYAASAAGVADAVGEGARWRWPDEVEHDGRVVARLGVHAELGPAGVDWAVVTVLRHGAGGDRARVLATTIEHIERAHARDSEAVLAGLRPRCSTLGGSVRALMIPMGPSGPRVEGVATDLKDDGALLIVTPAGGRIAVRPQHLGLLEPLDPG